MRIKFKLAFFIIFFVVAMSFIMPICGRIGAGTELAMRKARLQKWCKDVNEYVQNYGKLPSSLFEMVVEDIQTGTWSHAPIVVWVDEEGRKEVEKGLKPNKELFENTVEYALLSYRDYWYIIELKGGPLFKERMLIDNNGSIYILEKEE